MMRANEVLSEQEQIKQARMGAMRPIITQIEHKIREQAIHNMNAPYILYEVPSFIFGYPLYSMKDAIEWLMNEILRGGYWVWNVNETYLLISWLKPVKTKDIGRPVLTTNYRPMPYDSTFMPHNDS
jgi:hypothetical protein